jgi:hypothetical protein
LLDVITIIADNEFHAVEGFYESVGSNAETMLRVLGKLARLGLSFLAPHAIPHGRGGKSQFFGVVSQDKTCRSGKQRRFTSANFQNANAVRLLPRQRAHDQRAVCPRTGEADVEMIAASFGLEAADSGRAGAAVGRDPVAEGAVLANEAATVWLRRIPGVSPFTMDQQQQPVLLVACEDVTDRKRAEYLAEHVFETIPDIVSRSAS